MPWRHPWTSLICGPTSSGKSVFVARFLKHLEIMSDTKFDRIVVYYSEFQPSYRELGENVEFREGLPHASDWAGDIGAKLIIIDDLMAEASSTSGGSVVANLFTKGSHHNNLSVIYIVQNLFHRNKWQRDISLNSHYIVVFRNLRDQTQIQYLSRQLCPQNPLYLQDAYRDATSRPFGYLLLDLKQDTPENCRFRACIFPDDEYNFVYVPRKNVIKSADGANEVAVVSAI